MNLAAKARDKIRALSKNVFADVLPFASAQGDVDESHLRLALLDSLLIFIFRCVRRETQKMMHTYDPKSPAII
jgi:hypothetical protein